MALGHHIRIRLADGRAIATTPEQRRVVARVILEQGRKYHLLAGNLADTHLHALTPEQWAAASRFSHAVESSLKQRLRLEVGFVQYPHIPIRDQYHLVKAFRYILTQQEHHNLDDDPWRESSNLPDLLGLRLVGGYTVQNVRRWLPRVRRQQILEWIGLSDLRPADEPLDLLVDAVLASTCLPSLDKSSRWVVAARRAAIEVTAGRLDTRELAALLGIRPRTVQWLKTRPANSELVQAIRLQLGFMAGIRSRRYRDESDPFQAGLG